MTTKPPATKVRRPAGLKRSATLWQKVTSTYQLRPDEIRVLEDACRQADLVDRFQRIVDRLDDLTTPGSMGQLVTHPAVTEVRQHRAALARLLAQLKLPDSIEGVFPQSTKGSPSDRARVVAHARWTRK